MVKKPEQERVIDAYDHEAYKRANNPMAGMAQYDNEESKNFTYAYDPHFDPALEWAGKAEHELFEVPTSSIHIHESIKPSKIIGNLQKHREDSKEPSQGVLFGETVQEETERRAQAIEFYQHGVDWTNRLIAGDSLAVMNSLLQKEGMGGQVQMVYIDPPYGISYKSNFQPLVNNTNVAADKDESIDTAPEQITAFRDTWELGIHSYLTYLRDRIKLAHELLAETGSIFIQISNANVHFVRNLCDEVFGYDNFMSQIAYATTTGAGSPNALTSLSSISNYLVWYAKDKSKVKYHQIYQERVFGGTGSSGYKYIELPNKERESISKWEKAEGKQFDYLKRPIGSRVFAIGDLKSQSASNATNFSFTYKGKEYNPGKNYWKTNREGMSRLIAAGRVGLKDTGSIGYVRYFDDFPYYPITNMWTDTVSAFMSDKVYVVQTNNKVIERCMLMCTDPGDLVLDPTCGSGTTAYNAEKWGRRWITIDTSRVAVEIAKKRLMSATYDYFKLADSARGIDSGLVYEQAAHVTLRSIARGEDPEVETLYDRPLIDKERIRISGPFTVEAVPSPVVISPSEEVRVNFGDETQIALQDELKATGIIDKNGNRIRFSRVDLLEGTSYLQAEGETEEEIPRRAVICFGSATKPLDRRFVDRAMEEAAIVKPKPQLLVFAAFQFDPEAGDLINAGVLPGTTCLQVQMNPDLLVTDLKKKQRTSQSFYMVGQPDVEIAPLNKDRNQWQVEVKGFDYYDMKSGDIKSGAAKDIAMWMLDEDYDGMCFEPEQVFFPKNTGGWGKLAKNLKAEIDPDRMKAFEGTKSLPFTAAVNTRVAVKIVDLRGIESIRVLTIKER